MSRSGDEMILELSRIIKTAEEKKEVTKPDGSKETTVKTPDGGEETTKVVGGTKTVTKKKTDGTIEKKTTSAVLLDVVNGLAKIAADLDTAGEQEASSLVDDALEVILNQIKSAKIKPIEPADIEEADIDIEEEGEVPPEEDITEVLEHVEPITGREEGMGTRQGPKLEEFSEEVPEGLRPEDLHGDWTSGRTEDPADVSMRDPEIVHKLKELGLFGR